jgi:hypothetical protein
LIEYVAAVAHVNFPLVLNKRVAYIITQNIL